MKTVTACACIWLMWRFHIFGRSLLVSSLSTPSGDVSSTARRKILTSASVALAASTATPKIVNGYNGQRSRSDGYLVQKSDSEWHSILTPTQYNILREGGTERPNFSILESEERPGVFSCAGCATDLFESSQKFHSGTGWPSFAKGLAGVENDNVGTVQARLLGAELRCKTCGGHLGDVFSDGYLFVGTPAFATGKRLCIDGSALVFHPQEDGAAEIRGDKPKPQTTPDWLKSPEIRPA